MEPIAVRVNSTLSWRKLEEMERHRPGSSGTMEKIRLSFWGIWSIK